MSAIGVGSAQRAAARGATKRALRSGVKKPPSAKKRGAPPGGLAAVWQGRRPLHRIERVVVRIAQRREAADVEVARAVILERRQRGVLAEDIAAER